MSHKNRKKGENWTFSDFLKNFFWILSEFYYSFKNRLYFQKHNVLNFMQKSKKNLYWKYRLKQAMITFIFFYYLFQLLSPVGFLLSIGTYIHRYMQLQNEITILEEKRLYLTNTIKAIENKNEDAIEEFMINNTSKQIKNQRQFVHLE